MIQAPIFHVNGDDPAAVVHAAGLAIAFRQQFKMDVLIDLWCYRRHGHNEADDPTFTQPLMYREIEGHPPVAQIFAEKLVDEKRIEPGEADASRRKCGSTSTKHSGCAPAKTAAANRQPWAAYGKDLSRAGSDWSASDGGGLDVLHQVTSGAARLPADFTLHRKLQRLLDAAGRNGSWNQAG